MKVIDIHRHDREPEEVEQKRAQWDSLGYAHVCYSGNLEFIRALMKCYPGYVIGFAYLKMDDGPFNWRNDEEGRTERVPVEQIDRYREEGFRGLKVIYTDKAYSDADYFPYYERAQKLKMPILFHTGWVSGRRAPCVPRHENYQPVYLQTIASNFPELRIIGAHFGGWQFSEEAVIAMWKHPNVYCDLCGGTVRARPVSWYRELFSMLPAEDPEGEPELNLSIFGKFVYGTDNNDGIMNFYRYLFRELNIPEDLQHDIFYNNMAKALGLESGDRAHEQHPTECR